MSTTHRGNLLNEVNFEEHDGVNNAKRVNVVQGSFSVNSTATITLYSTPTLFAVVNTAAAGQASVRVDGNVTLSDSKGFIGLVTVVQSSVARTITGNITLSDPKGFIGLVTVVGSLSAAAGNVTLDPGSRTGIIGNITLSDPKGFIGLVTVVGSLSAAAGNITLDAGSRTGLIGTVTIQDGGNSITVDGSVGVLGNVTLSDSKGFIGLVTAVTRNAGTNKTLISIPLFLSTSSQATIVVPATNLSVYVTSVLINSDATVRVSIKSGVTYLTGNASIGVTLNPGGGWVEAGSPDSPVYISTPSASINVEKFDMTATKANVGGKLIYFTE